MEYLEEVVTSGCCSPTGPAGPAELAALVGAVLHGPGSDSEVGLWLGGPVTLGALRRLVAQRQDQLRDAGIGPGASMAVWLPASLAYVSTLLASWCLGAQVVLLDHRLTRHEVDRALVRLRPQLLVSPRTPVPEVPLRGHHPVTAFDTVLAGHPAETEHALVQLSSGSTGPSKVIGRTAGGILAELARYRRVPGMPGRGERVVVLSSLNHTFGLIGGLLHGLHAGAEVVLADRLTSNGILISIAAGRAPTTVLGVPFHLELMAAVTRPPALPQLVGAVSAGELIRPAVPAAFADRYQLPLGECYGMTEVGLIAMDIAGAHRPAIGPPAPGIEVRAEGGELLVACPSTPYLCEADPARWAGGWLRTRDAGTVDPVTGAVRILGRLDSQVSVGGLTVDLSEVEHTLTGLPGVAEATVVFDGGIDAYLALRPAANAAAIDEALAGRLAPFKRPRQLHVVSRLPRTASGKQIRDLESLRAAAGWPGNGEGLVT